MDVHGPATDPWWYPESDNYPGEAVAVAGAAGDDFLEIEDLLGLAWEGDAAVSCVRSSPPRTSPPSEDVMAAWLYPIVSGEDNAGDGPMVNGGPSTMATGSTLRIMMTESKGKLQATEGMSDVKDTNITSDSSERRKADSGGGGSKRTRPSRHSQTHNDTEKRRRCKISDRLRTLRQLVPGCKKTNQASTLEQTIQYMKSLQQQVHAVNVRPAQAVYPIMQTASVPAVAMPLAPPDAVAPGMVVGTGGRVPLLPAGMAPFGAMLPFPYPQYHAVMMPAPFYRPQTAASAAPGPGAQCFVSTEEHCNKGKR